MLINDKIRDLVSTLDVATENGDSLVVDKHINELINELRVTCYQPENQSRYAAYSATPGEIGKYPLDNEDYARAFDPLKNEEDFYDQWSQQGVVISPNIVSSSTCETTVKRIHELIKELSNGECDLSRPETYDAIPVDKEGIAVLSRGFFEIYHDDSLAQLRQAVHAYIHHVVIWGTPDLWTTFDRFGVKLPAHKESGGLPLHVDQNPITNPSFNSLQGLLALADCPTERGTLLVVPGSKRYFAEYGNMSKKHGEYVELDPTSKLTEELIRHAQPLPLRAGSLVSWDSRTTHSNTKNISGDTRTVAYISTLPAREESPDLLAAREEAFSTGLAKYNHAAGLRVSTKPRYTAPELIAQIRKPEQLYLLGKLLYGKKSYRTI